MRKQMTIVVIGALRVNETSTLEKGRKGMEEKILFICVKVLRPTQPIMVMSSTVSLPNHTFSWAGLVQA